MSVLAAVIPQLVRRLMNTWACRLGRTMAHRHTASATVFRRSSAAPVVASSMASTMTLEHLLLPRPFASISPIGLPAAVSGSRRRANQKHGVSTSNYVAPESPMNPTSPNQAPQQTRREHRGGHRCLPSPGMPPERRRHSIHQPGVGATPERLPREPAHPRPTTLKGWHPPALPAPPWIQPLQGCPLLGDAAPRVARPSQPWAGRWNASGVLDAATLLRPQPSEDALHRAAPAFPNGCGMRPGQPTDYGRTMAVTGGCEK